MSIVKKPAEGYHSPYQTIVEGFSTYMLSQLSNTQPNYEKWRSLWEALDEHSCDITTPVYDDNRQLWKTAIQAHFEEKKNNIPLTFSTITVKHFLDKALISVKRERMLGKSITEPGFYFTRDTQQVIYVNYSDFDFSSSILFEGWELDTESYTVSDDKQVMVIDTPIVSGTIPIILIDKPNINLAIKTSEPAESEPAETDSAE